MTTKPKTRKAPVAAIDPVFAAIAEHKVLTRESNRLEGSCKTARAKAEKRYGKWERTPNPREWPGETTVTPFYVRCNRAGRAERKAAMRMARTKPTTLAGVAAMITMLVARSRWALRKTGRTGCRPHSRRSPTRLAEWWPHDDPPPLPHLEASRAVLALAAAAREARVRARRHD